MGTRADFYVGQGLDAEWLGSVAYDGDSSVATVCAAKTEEEFRQLVEVELRQDHATRPAQGWPWPWKTSYLTDEAAAFFDGEPHRLESLHVGTVWPTWWLTVPEWQAFSALDQEFDEDADLVVEEERAGKKRAAFLWGLGAPATLPDMSARAAVTLGPRSGVLFFEVP